jgi:leucyl aminopeptidase (aminopeptidase T)
MKTIARWGELGEIVIRQMAAVKPGENLLILADTWTDIDIAEACLVAGFNAKADAQLLVIPRMAPTDTREFNAITSGAIEGSDVIVAFCEMIFLEKEATRRACEKGTRIVSCMPRGMEDFLIAGMVDIDIARLNSVAAKIGELWTQTELCQVTSSLGTDISFKLKGRPVDVGDGTATEPGKVGYFPGPDVGIAPIEDTINGTLVVDGCIDPVNKLVSAPITLSLEKGVIKSIQGGADAQAWRASLESVDDPKAFHLCHFTIGLNPRAKPSNNMHECEHVLGAITFGFGSQAPIFQGTVGPAKIHSDVVLLSATVRLDGKVMCENNKLNPELGLDGF